MQSTALIVDDSPVSRTLATTLLQRHGWRVVCCATGEEALIEIQALSPALLLCDISLPGMPGTELLAQVINKGIRPPHCIAYTAHSMAHERKVIDQAGFDAILTKPISPSELQHLLEALAHE